MYNKLFASILDSSVWLLDHATVRVWITLMAARDQDGFARFATVQNLADRAKVTAEEAKSAIAKFEAPDVDSSNPAHEGRRVERVPGGWQILNAKHYDEIASKAQQRATTRERVARFREKKRSQANAATPPAETRPPEPPPSTPAPPPADDQASRQASTASPPSSGLSGASSATKEPEPDVTGLTARGQFLARVPNRVTWEQELKSITEGIYGAATTPTEEQIETAFRDMMHNGVEPATCKLPQFRRYIQVVIAGDKALPNMGGPAQRSNGTGTTRKAPPPPDYKAPTTNADDVKFT